MTFERRDYQARIIAKTVNFWREGTIRAILIESPTGSGKTFMGLHACQDFKDETGTEPILVWVAMRHHLLEQVVKEHRKFGLNVDLRPLSMFDTKYRETLEAEIEMNPDRPVILCIDEAQHDAATTMTDVYQAIKPDYIIGLSATPYRADKAKLCFEKQIRDAGIHRLISDGYLSKFNLHMLEEWTPESVTRAYFEDPQKWGKSVFYFLNSEQAAECHQRLLAGGATSHLVLGTNNNNDELIADFRSGKVDCLVNCMILTEGFDCLSEDTEILTEDGWKGIDEVTIEDRCWSVNQITGQNELVPVQGVNNRQLRNNEQIFHLENQHIDIMVTGGHNILYKYRDPSKSGCLEDRLSNNFQVKTAVEMSEKSGEWQLPLIGLGVENHDAEISDNDIRLLGWMQTDGSIEGTAIEITQSEKESKHSEAIRNLLNDLGYNYRESFRPANQNGFDTEYGQFRFYIHSADIQHLRPWMSKTQLNQYSTLSRRQFAILWDTMMLGNGNLQYSSNGNQKNGMCWFGYEQQADTFHRLALINGFTSYHKVEKTPQGNDIWRISARDKRWMSFRSSDHRSHGFEPIEYSGRVWCVGNQNGTLIIRRNGKTAVVGNCPELQTAWVRDSSKGPTMQMAGRAYRIHPDIPRKHVVQSVNTKWPMSRTATPEEQYKLVEGRWLSIKPNKRIDEIAVAAVRRTIANYQALPDYVSKRSGKGKPVDNDWFGR